MGSRILRLLLMQLAPERRQGRHNPNPSHRLMLRAELRVRAVRVGIVPEAAGHRDGTPAMRYAARHTALSRVEEILAHSYSARSRTF
jgi:hypothetical protein